MSLILKMKDICKDYPLGKTTLRVLNNVDLQVEQGEYLAIMGPSGSGKTTLMNLIGCLDVPTSGEYELDGVDITTCSDNQLAEVRNKKIGFVFQSFNLLPKTSAIENVALPLLYAGVSKSKRIERAKELLIKVGLEERMDFKQDQLSGGQCQRVAIARALAGKPQILLADEPTGALDSESGRQIMELFAEIHKQGTTIIMITHDAKVASHADRIVHISDGVLYENLSETAQEAEEVLETAAEESVEATVVETAQEAAAAAEESAETSPETCGGENDEQES